MAGMFDWMFQGPGATTPYNAPTPAGGGLDISTIMSMIALAGKIGGALAPDSPYARAGQAVVEPAQAQVLQRSLARQPAQGAPATATPNPATPVATNQPQSALAVPLTGGQPTTAPAQPLAPATPAAGQPMQPTQPAQPDYASQLLNFTLPTSPGPIDLGNTLGLDPQQVMSAYAAQREQQQQQIDAQRYANTLALQRAQFGLDVQGSAREDTRLSMAQQEAEQNKPLRDIQYKKAVAELANVRTPEQMAALQAKTDVGTQQAIEIFRKTVPSYIPDVNGIGQLNPATGKYEVTPLTSEQMQGALDFYKMTTGTKGKDTPFTADQRNAAFEAAAQEAVGEFKKLMGYGQDDEQLNSLFAVDPLTGLKRVNYYTLQGAIAEAAKSKPDKAKELNALLTSMTKSAATKVQQLAGGENPALALSSLPALPSVPVEPTTAPLADGATTSATAPVAPINNGKASAVQPAGTPIRQTRGGPVIGYQLPNGSRVRLDGKTPL